ncbi:hypothetical protein SCA03_04010 [Streptomyces cacaoi]|uniref:Uncharacterized protein n=1 Tax=Streptomyces cacaoi TaxID=1898 RepID=A0A4Y3QV26_STRCI|nr:hypothetical protein SCA03_04010 [Streptomyces cacaoi]
MLPDAAAGGPGENHGCDGRVDEHAEPDHGQSPVHGDPSLAGGAEPGRWVPGAMRRKVAAFGEGCRRDPIPVENQGVVDNSGTRVGE